MDKPFFLKECHVLFEKEFSNDWISTVKFDKLAEIRTAFDKINSFSEQSFVLLSKSILAGEYIYAEDFSKQIIEFIDSSFVEQGVFDLNPRGNTNRAKLFRLYQDLYISLNDALRHYQAFSGFAKKKFDATPQSNKFVSFRSLKNAVDCTNVLKYIVSLVLPVCKLDYHFPSNDDEFQELLHVRTRLSSSVEGSFGDIAEIYSILLFKCNFTIRRLKKDTFLFLLDSNVTRIIPEELDVDGLSKILCKSDYVDNSVEQIQEWTNAINCSDPDLEAFVRLMIYYKEHANIADKKKIEKLIERFEHVYAKNADVLIQTVRQQYDRFSYDSVLNFIKNCYFSYLVETQNLKLSDIKKQITTIQDIQRKTKVRNFYPYRKAIDAVLECIDNHLNYKDIGERLIEDKLAEVSTLLESFRDSLTWSSTHRFFPFQLTYNESIVEIHNIDVFIPSTFAKIIDYEKLEEDFMQLKRKKELLEQKFDLTRTKVDIEQIKNNIKQSERKSMDLLILFTGVITFLFGTINIFVENRSSDFHQLIVNTSVLGIILLLFVCLLLLLSPVFLQPMKIKCFFKTARFWLSLLFIFVFGFLVYCTFTGIEKQEKIHMEQPEHKLLDNEVATSISDTCVKK